MPAPVQITAEQLLREAKERELELVQPPPKQKISDPDELKAYKLRKRKEFEDNIRKNRTSMINWIKYTAWEESQKEIQRARSVYERALDVDHRNIVVWLKYAEMEMRLRQVNHARNVWDRAITILPRANQFWYKYSYMEEMLGNAAGARQVFERWMEWQPEEQAWQSYINFELRYKELDRARAIYEKYVIVHPEVKNWIKYAKFEEKHHYINSARQIFERAVEFFGDDNISEQLLIAFAKFEEGQREHERARCIYKYSLDKLDKDRCDDIYKAYTIHEKKYGDRTAIEDVIVSKRKFKYEEDAKNNPHDYDVWFDYLKLMENEGDTEQVRDLYERAIANVPPAPQKRHWRRYIYLWINYALYEELEAQDMDRCRQVYQACLELIPHKKFTFAKIWLMFAHFEIRQKELSKARKVLGAAIGKCPKDKLFRGYIDLELQLREFDRCRILYEKFLQFNPENCTTWMKYTELETILGDLDRTRAVFELAVSQPKLDMPEVLWKSYIDFEIEQEEFEHTRTLYRRLLKRTQHVKIWVSFATFELSRNQEDAIPAARGVYKEAYKGLKENSQKEERLMLLEEWKEFEHEHGDDSTQEDVAKLMPSRVKNRRKIQTEDGSDAGWEEYYDYIFPDDESSKPHLALLAKAKKWKENISEDEDEDDSDEDSSDDDEEEKEDNPVRAPAKVLSSSSDASRIEGMQLPGGLTRVEGLGLEPVATESTTAPADEKTMKEYAAMDADSDSEESSSSSSSSSDSDSDSDSDKKK